MLLVLSLNISWVGGSLNDTVFSISNFTCTLLVYRKETDFLCTLQSYYNCLLVLEVVALFLINYFRFSIYMITSSSKKDSFIFSFPINVHFICFFFCLTALARTFNIVLKKSGEGGTLAFYLILVRNFFFLTMKYGISYRCFVNTFYQVEKLPLYF